MEINKKKITLVLTRSEAEWLWNKLQGIKVQNKQAGTPPALQEAYTAGSLQDRIESEDN
jgi:hypothetical protein